MTGGRCERHDGWPGAWLGGCQLIRQRFPIDGGNHGERTHQQGRANPSPGDGHTLQAAAVKRILDPGPQVADSDYDKKQRREPGEDQESLDEYADRHESVALFLAL